MGVVAGRSRTLALSTVVIVAAAAACLRTESLGSEESPVVTCDKSSCTGTPSDTLCTDGRKVASTGRCVRTESGTCGWEPGDCASDAGSIYGDAVGDTALMCSDGEVPLTGMGPWDEAKRCWAPMIHNFQCILKNTGGPANNCFVELSTGKYFLTETTQIPCCEYRECTKEERESRLLSLTGVCP